MQQNRWIYSSYRSIASGEWWYEKGYWFGLLFSAPPAHFAPVVKIPFLTCKLLFIDNRAGLLYQEQKPAPKGADSLGSPGHLSWTGMLGAQDQVSSLIQYSVLQNELHAFFHVFMLFFTSRASVHYNWGKSILMRLVSSLAVSVSPWANRPELRHLKHLYGGMIMIMPFRLHLSFMHLKSVLWQTTAGMFLSLFN